uniref:Uncharacterized protein n=1 Tax=Pipistrellus kuhlii TaxID=59472 RepID=A0A7J7UGL5_PIPKU|nr:hypothetical protein mPipKuh1_009118 [Pipistrellus kuhlii]
MPAIVTTLGILTFYLFPLVPLFTFLTLLPPGQVSQRSCPGAGCFSNLPAAAASPQAGRLRGERASPSACRPRGCPLHRLPSCESSMLLETEVRCGGKSEADLRQKEGVFPSTWRELPRRGHAASRPATSRLTFRGILTLDDKALSVNMLLVCNFENKIETSCILKYKMKCDALYTI